LARKRTSTGTEGTLADQVAQYVGKSLGDLLNRRDALLKEVASIDSQVAAVSKKVAKQFGRWVPYSGAAPDTKAGKASKAGSKRQRRKFTAEQRAEVSERMRKYWAARRKAAKG
jgi:hypothetical protein